MRKKTAQRPHPLIVVLMVLGISIPVLTKAAGQTSTVNGGVSGGVGVNNGTINNQTNTGGGIRIAPSAHDNIVRYNMIEGGSIVNEGYRNDICQNLAGKNLTKEALDTFLEMNPQCEKKN